MQNIAFQGDDEISMIKSVLKNTERVLLNSKVKKSNNK